MNDLGLLAADFEDVIVPLVVILFGILSFVGQMLKKLRQAQQAPPQGRGGAHRPAGQPPRAAPAPDPLRQEVGDFVRRGGERGGGMASRGGAAGSHASEAAGPPDASRREGIPPTRRQPTAQRPGQARVLLEKPPAAGARVAEDAAQHLPSPQLGTLATQGERGPALADDTMENHLQKVFDHQVGTLRGAAGGSARRSQPEPTPAPEGPIPSVPPTAAAGLAAMLATSANLRQAILLSEILQRPEHRWG